MNPFAYIKIAGLILLGVLIGYGPGLYHGKSIAKSELEAKAAKDALERVAGMEKSNAAFKNLSSRDRCLVIMRDSELPESNCDR